MSPNSKVTLALSVLLPLGIGTALAEGGVPLPKVPVATGGQCVEDPVKMRREHMDMLKHQRDETMYNGIRTKKYALKECIDCHVPADNDFAKDGHFCKNCHVYAAVSVDCFQCHNPMPEDASAPVPADGHSFNSQDPQPLWNSANNTVHNLKVELSN